MKGVAVQNPGIKLVTRMDMFDWTEGIAICQVRVAPTDGATCKTELFGGVCLPELKEQAADNLPHQTQVQRATVRVQ